MPYTTPDGLEVDLGGEFVHGAEHNLLWDLAQSQGWVLRHVFDIDDPKELQQQAVAVNGTIMPFDSEVCRRVNDGSWLPCRCLMAEVATFWGFFLNLFQWANQNWVP